MKLVNLILLNDFEVSEEKNLILLICYKIASKRKTINYSKYFRKSSCDVLACSIIDFNTPTLTGSCLGTVTLLPSLCFNWIWIPITLSFYSKTIMFD